MSARGGTGAVVLGVALACAVTLAQAPPETFTAIASVKQGEASIAANVSVTVQRYASEEERTAVVEAVRKGGTAGVKKALAAMKDAGFIQLGERRTPIKFASRRPVASGNLITVAAAEPILFLGKGLPDAKPTTGFDVAVALFEVKESGDGVGELAPAAKLAVDANGALRIDDYGPTVIWLKSLTRAK